MLFRPPALRYGATASRVEAESENLALEEETAVVRLQSLDNPRVLLRLPIAGQTADESPSPSGRGRGEGEWSGNQQRSVIWPKQAVARLSLTLDPSPAGRGKQRAGTSKLGIVAGHFSSMPNIRGREGRGRAVRLIDVLTKNGMR